MYTYIYSPHSSKHIKKKSQLTYYGNTHKEMSPKIVANATKISQDESGDSNARSGFPCYHTTITS